MNTEEQKSYERKRTFPVNQLDSAWLSADPDYTNIQNEYKELSPNFSKIFSLFNPGIRLSKLSDAEARLCEYDLVTAGDLLDLGLFDAALSVFLDIAAILETRQSKSGFRSEQMNKVTQEIRKMEQSQKNKNVFGGNKKNE